MSLVHLLHCEVPVTNENESGRIRHAGLGAEIIYGLFPCLRESAANRQVSALFAATDMKLTGLPDPGGNPDAGIPPCRQSGRQMRPKPASASPVREVRMKEPMPTVPAGKFGNSMH